MLFHSILAVWKLKFTSSWSGTALSGGLGLNRPWRQNNCVSWHIFQTRRNMWNIPGIRQSSVVPILVQNLNIYKSYEDLCSYQWLHSLACPRSPLSTVSDSTRMPFHGLIWLKRVEVKEKRIYKMITESKMILVLWIYQNRLERKAKNSVKKTPSLASSYCEKVKSQGDSWHLKISARVEKKLFKLYVRGLNCTLPANFEWQRSERRQIRITSSNQRYVIKIIFQRIGSCNQNKFWEFSAIHKARQSWIRHYQTQTSLQVRRTGGFVLQSTIGYLGLSYCMEQRK